MQDVIAILIVAAAAGFLVRRAWRRVLRRSGGACGGCSTCPGSDSMKTHELVTLQPLKSPK
jgi:hypothetical protein